jgi:hypothetical protein
MTSKTKQVEHVCQDGQTYIFKDTTVTLVFDGKSYKYPAKKWTNKATKETGIEDIELTNTVGSDLFKFCEKKLNTYLEEYAHPHTVQLYENDFDDCGPALCKKGAIRGVIEMIEEVMTDEKLTFLNLDKNWDTYDLDVAFQP